MKPRKTYEDFIISLTLASKSRADLRKVIVNAFLEEKGGYWSDGKQVVTRYKYFVESLMGGQRIFLLRPTFLNKGIDFQVWVEKFDGVSDKRPSHNDLINDLKQKYIQQPRKAASLLAAVERVWNCDDPDTVITESALHYNSGFSLDLVLKSLKWLFIEQDVTYWNYDGRLMLWRAIRETLNN